MFRIRTALTLALVCTLAILSHPAAPRAVSPDIVISQVYGGGGNTGAPYTHDFVELFNRGETTVSLAGLSVQYASATGTGNFASATPLAGSLAPGQFYLVQMSGGATGVPLPTPDAIGTAAMAAGSGKVILATTTTGLACNGGSTPCSAEQLALIKDLVGYGGANFFEGAAPAPTLSNTTAGFRANNGCTDTDNNGADFTAATPAPRNSSSALLPCVGPTDPSGAGLASPDSVESGETTLLTVAVTPGTNPASTGITVAGDLSSIGGSSTQSFFDDGTNGDVTAGDDIFSFFTTATGTVGAKSLPITVSDAQARSSITTIAFTIRPPPATAADVVVSQVYGGGGNTGAPYTHDYVELFNRGTATVSLAGWSVQYASATGTGNFGSNVLASLTGSLAPGQYYLIRGGGGTNGVPLPTPDAIGSVNMSATSGKVALIASTAGLACNGGSTPCSAEQLAQILDLVGFGSANFFEGSGSAPAPSNTTAIFRKGNGSIDTDDNANDFIVGAPHPRNQGSVRPLSAAGAATPGLVVPGGETLLTVTVSPATEPDSTGITVTGDLAAIGGPASQPFFDDGTNGDDTADDLVFSYRATVAGTTTEGTKTITALVGDEQSRSTTTSFSVIVPGAPIPIHQIQGDGPETPLLGQTVTTTGIVTGVKNNGFFIQTPDGHEDGNPATSEGLFVFTSTMPAASTGDRVLVTGTATEFFTLTQIAGSPGSFAVLASHEPLPAPVVLTPEILDPAGAHTQLERFEGMRVHAPTLVTIAPTNQFGEIEAVLGGVPRPMREPGIGISLSVPPDPVSLEVDCCIPRWDENPERIMIDTDALAGMAVVSTTSNVTFANVTGPLDFTFSRYKIAPQALTQTTPDMTAVPVPAPAANEFTVGSFNIQNFSGNATQRRKAALAIRNLMRSPDVIGLIEISSQTALQALGDEVNALAVDAGDPNPGYTAYLELAFPGATQNLGFLVKSARVQVNAVTQERADETFISPRDGLPTAVHDRPPLVLRATVDPSGVNPGDIVVLVNHPRSFIDIEMLTPAGEHVRMKRTLQAESIAGLLQELQAGHPATPIIAVGDYNAFEFNDGHTDPIAVIKGSPTPDEEVVVWGSPDLVDPDFINLTDGLPRAERYSYVFDGNAQAIDHVLVNEVAHALVQRYAVARSNADFPATAVYTGDATRPERNSDHDMPVAYFALPGTPVVVLNGDSPMTVEAFTTFVDPGATASDANGPLPVTVTGTVDVNTPGTYTLSYTASNVLHSTTITRTVHVVDTIAPVISGFQLSLTTLWPVNHELMPVAAFYTATDASGQVSCALDVTSNEPVNGVGDGHTAPDWIVDGPHDLRLRAERSGRGSGRVYTVTALCIDPSGNAATAMGTVTVPRNQ
jgi:uncharacterized protein